PPRLVLLLASVGPSLCCGWPLLLSHRAQYHVSHWVAYPDPGPPHRVTPQRAQGASSLRAPLRASFSHPPSPSSLPCLCFPSRTAYRSPGYYASRATVRLGGSSSASASPGRASARACRPWRTARSLAWPSVRPYRPATWAAGACSTAPQCPQPLAVSPL